MPWRTVRQNIRLPLELLRRAETSGLDDVVKLTELQKYESQLPDELSGGQAQRASLARALVTHPPFLFLDEPFTGLDFLLRRKLNEALLTWIQTINATTVIVTHDPREAVFLSDYIIVLGQPPTKVLMAQPVPLSRPRHAAKPSADFEKFCSVLENTLNPHIN
jgi:NitT/TauT family transport system ATP-binding protein